MRSRTANWFECTVRYERQMEDGMTKKVPELYVVDALSFGEAEEAITREMSAYVSGEFEVKNINPAAYTRFSSARMMPTTAGIRPSSRSSPSTRRRRRRSALR